MENEILYFSFYSLCNKLHILKMEQKVYNTVKRNYNFVVIESRVGTSCTDEKQNQPQPMLVIISVMLSYSNRHSYVNHGLFNLWSY